MHIPKILFLFIFITSVTARTHAINDDDLLQEFANFSLIQDQIIEAFELLDKNQPAATISVHFKTIACLEKIYEELCKYPHIRHITINNISKKITQNITRPQFAAFMQKVYHAGIKIHLPFLQPQQDEESTSTLDANLY